MTYTPGMAARDALAANASLGQAVADGGKMYRLDLTTAAQEVAVDKGEYLAYLDVGATPTTSVLFIVATSSSDALVDAASGASAALCAFRADSIERISVTALGQSVRARILAGTATMRLVRLL